MSSTYTEQDCERFYDAEDSHYRSFWDAAGSLHWGIFDNTTGNDFLKACANLNSVMATKIGVSKNSRVIDMGCGNGNTAMWLAESAGCQVLGVDLSGVRIQNAKKSLESRSDHLRKNVSFEKASMTELPFEDGAFTHGWSQATIYHIPDKDKALHEAHRVLKKGATFVFDDLIKPKPDISAAAKQYVYDRLLFDTDYSFEGYQKALTAAGFEVVEAIDLSDHLSNSYACLADMAGKMTGADEEHFRNLSIANRKMIECIDRRELGWAMYVCRA